MIKLAATETIRKRMQLLLSHKQQEQSTCSEYGIWNDLDAELQSALTAIGVDSNDDDAIVSNIKMLSNFVMAKQFSAMGQFDPIRISYICQKALGNYSNVAPKDGEQRLAQLQEELTVAKTKRNTRKINRKISIANIDNNDSGSDSNTSTHSQTKPVNLGSKFNESDNVNDQSKQGGNDNTPPIYSIPQTEEEFDELMAINDGNGVILNVAGIGARLYTSYAELWHAIVNAEKEQLPQNEKKDQEQSQSG